MLYRVKPFSFVLSLFILLPCLTACSKKIDTKKLEVVIQENFDKSGIGIESVDCPEGVKLQVGNQFDCQITLESKQLVAVKVEQQDDEGNVDWETREKITKKPVEAVTKLIEEELDQLQVEYNSLSCPKGIKVEAGNRFQCQLNLENKENLIVDITQTDNQGNLDWKIRGMILTNALEDIIQQGLQEEGLGNHTASCSDSAVIVALKDESFSCVAKSGSGKNIDIKVMPKDNYGGVQLSLE